MRFEMFSFFLLVFSVALVGSWMKRVAKERDKRLELLSQALSRPDLDEATRRLLVQQLGPKPPWISRLLGEGRHYAQQYLLAIGWLGCFLGIAVAVSSRRDEEVGVAIALLSFGLITLPFALREFEKRRPA